MPEKQTTYTEKFTVYRTDGDHLGNVKLGALLRYAQQVATAHAEAVGLDDACTARPTPPMCWPSWPCTLSACPALMRSSTLPHPGRKTASGCQQAHSPIFMMPPAQRPPSWTAAGCSLIRKSASSCASIPNSSMTSGPPMSRLSCRSSCPALPLRTARCWGSSRLSTPAAI